MTDWSALSRAEVEEALGCGPDGLTNAEAAERLVKVGPNAIAEASPPSAAAVLLSQFRSPLVYILLIAMVVTIAIDELIDAGVIFAVLVLNASIGFFQERKAEGAVRALMGLVAPRAHVVREGLDLEIESLEVVPGDLVLLESGRRVPADLRLVATTGFQVDESLLTGESVPVAKRSEVMEPSAVAADRVNLAYAGTVVTSGRARGIVVATGDQTELGRIATRMREEVEPPTPLQRRMTRFARTIGVVVVA